MSKFNHTRWRACSYLIRQDEREKSAVQARRDACILSTWQARWDTCEQQGRPCSSGSELFDLHAPAAASLALNFSINGLIKAPGRRVFACDPMAAFALICSCFQLIFRPNLNCHIGQRIIRPQIKWQRIIRRQIYNGADNNCLTYSG